MSPQRLLISVSTLTALWGHRETDMQNRYVLVCYERPFIKKKRFLRKKSKPLEVRWFLFFSVKIVKSQISLREAVSEENVKQHKYLVKLFQNLKY